MKAFSISLILLFFCTVNISCIGVTSRLKKCCPPSDVFDASTMSCVQNKFYENKEVDFASNVSSKIPSLLPELMLDLSGSGKRIVETQFDESDLSENGLIKCVNGRFKVLDLSDEFQYLITNEATLVSIGGAFESSFQIGEFCLDLAASENGDLKRIALTCDPCVGSRSCIKTCCPHFQISDGTYECVNPPDRIHPLKMPQWNPTFESEREIVKNRDYILVNEKDFQCKKNRNNPSGLFLPTSENATFRLFPDGSIEITESGESLNVSSENFCVNFLAFSEDGKRLSDETFFICVEDDEEEETCIACNLYPICSSISCLFLVATFTVYAILPELRKSLVGKVIIIFVLALFVAYVFLTAVAFGGLALIENPAGCQLLAFLIQFFFLHAFFWMNVLSFVIFKSVRRTTLKWEDKRSVKIYAVYALATPILISIATAVAEFVPSENENLISIKPDFGQRKCFFDPDKQLSSLVFFYLPLLLILTTSIILFVLTICRISKNSWNTESVSCQQKSFRNHFSTAVKLYLILGINWIFEFVSFIAGWQWDQTLAKNLSYFSDVVNLLQGLLIFVVLVCNKKVWKKLKAKMSRQSESELKATRINSSTPIEILSS